MVNAPILVSLTPTPSSHSQDSVEDTLPGTSSGATAPPLSEITSSSSSSATITTSSTTNGLNYHNCQQQSVQAVACGKSKSTSEQGTQTDNDDEEDIDNDDVGDEGEVEDDDCRVNDYIDNDGDAVDENGDVEGVTDTQRTANGFHNCDYAVNEEEEVEVTDKIENNLLLEEGGEAESEQVAINEDEAVAAHFENLNILSNNDNNNVMNREDDEEICDSSEFCYSIPIESNSDNDNVVVKSELNNNIDQDESSDDDDDIESVKSVVDVVKNNSLKLLEPSTPPTIIVPSVVQPTTSTNNLKMTTNTYSPFTPHSNNIGSTQPPHYTVAQPQHQPVILGFAPVQPSRLHHHCPQHNPLPPNTQLQFISLQPQPGVPVSQHQPQNQNTSIAAVQSSTAGNWPFIEAPLFQIDAIGEPRPFCPAHPHGPTGPPDQRYVLHLDTVPTIQISPAAGPGIPQQQQPQQTLPQHHGGGKRKHHGYRGGEWFLFLTIFLCGWNLMFW